MSALPRPEPVAGVRLERGQPILSLSGVKKVFPNGTAALKGVDLEVAVGSVHGLVGANGAGKSTLVEILAGALSATSGTVRWKGDPIIWRSPGHATDAGLATIHQRIPLVPTLSVLENVFLWQHGVWRTGARNRRRYAEVLDRMRYDLDPDVLVENLSVGHRQMVAIVQALATGAELVVMDEPTASLAREERDLIFQTVRRLSAGGTSFVYVSHFLDEVLGLTDHLTVLRDGQVADQGPTSEFDESRLIGGIANKSLLRQEEELERKTRSRATASGDVLLKIERLTGPPVLGPTDLEVRAGEIVGLAGLMGSGRSELLHAIFGANNSSSGRVTVGDRVLSNTPSARVRGGIALVPEERLQQGLLPEDEIAKNISLPDLRRLSSAGVFPKRREELDRASAAIKRLNITASGPLAPVTSLSGGNAQKVLFAKWLYTDSRVFLFDEPFHGIDIGAKRDIIKLIQELVLEGNAVIIADAEFAQLLAIASRIVVLRRGQIVAEIDPADTDDSELLALASGLATKENL